MAMTIADFLIEIGVKADGVQKVQKDLEKMMKNTKGQSKQVTNVNKELSKQNAIESKRLALKRKIAQAEKAGVKDLKRERGALSGKDPTKLQKWINDLEDKRLDQIKKNEHTKARSREREAKAAQEALVNKQAQDAVEAKLLAKEKAKERYAKRSRDKAKAARKQAAVEARRATSPTKGPSAADLTTKRDAITASKGFRLVERVDVKRAAQLRSEIEKARTAADFRRARTQITLAAESARKLERNIKKASFSGKALSDSAKNMARSYLSVFAAAGAFTGLSRTVQEMEALDASFLAITGSSEGADREMSFVIGTAERLGLTLDAAASGYKNLSAAAGVAGFSVDESRDMFLGITEASKALGLSAEDTKGTLRA